jgi:hypothetical protein
VLQAAAGLSGGVVTSTGTSGARISGGGTIDANRGTLGNTVALSGCSDAAVLGVAIINGQLDGLSLTNCTRVVVDVAASANGRHGVYHNATTFCRGQITARDNGKSGATGSGVVFDNASTDNTYAAIVATDTRAGGAKTQQYGVLEVPASGCDRNTFASVALGGNAAGALSLVGASSGVPSGVPLASSVSDAQIAAGGLHNASLATDVARANQLINGGLEIWQRGTAFGTTGAYTADGWQMITAGTDLFSVSRDTTHTDNSPTCAFLSFTLGTGAGASRIQQSLKLTTDSYQLRGKTLSASVRINAPLANACRVQLGADGTGGATNASAFHPGDGAYHTLTVTLAVPVDATVVVLSVALAAGNVASFYVDNAMLVVGAVAADYAPLPPPEDLARCLRYYQRWSGNYYVGHGSAQVNTSHYIFVPYKAPMGGVPTLTVSAATDFTVLNETLGSAGASTSVAINTASTSSMLLLATTAAALGAAGAPKFLLGSTANSWLAVEWNP